jgi:hypothetical protein
VKLTRIAKAGLVLTGLGLLIFVGVAIWLKSIRTTVADIPMPMRAAALQKDFTVDHDAIYTMWVQSDRNIPLTTVKCLLGARKSELDAKELDCTNTPPLLKFSWELSRDGKSGGTGWSCEMGSSSTTDNTSNVDIVSFPAQKNHKYTVRLKFDQDASGLKISPPRVRIELDIFNREDFIWAGAAFDSIGFVLCIIGGEMFLVSFLRERINRFKTPGARVTPG